jgi:hydrogenase maturation protein HypF
VERRTISVHGIVQGVGFRPFVFQLATRLRLCGFVQNRTGTVHIEVEGYPDALDQFVSDLTERPPPLANIEQVSWEKTVPRGEQCFRIETSAAESASAVFISPDVATCPECLGELLDPADRRYRYPFLNCTNCGPRLTIIRGAPYDRPRTTMAEFAMCPACRAEYDNPADRRFHAEPTACPACGPHLIALDAAGRQVEAIDPLGWFVAALREGKIGALKGLGGYHLVCDARSAAAVAELRRRKHRDEKPFAIMVASIRVAEGLCVVDDAERALMMSPASPIVLLRKRAIPSEPRLPANAAGQSSSPSVVEFARIPVGASQPLEFWRIPLRGCEAVVVPAVVVDEVAPHNPYLGVMLPYTPLHHLLLRAAEDVPLVMTSGNRSDEPIAYRDNDAITRLAGIADVFLVHNRPIHGRCDDSVTRVVDGQEMPVRRSRGYAPRPIELPMACAGPILAVGGQLKATFALGRERQAFVSHHMGDLDYYEAHCAFVRDVDLYEELFAVRPKYLIHDLHPDYATTHYAQERAAREGMHLLTAQHHHAHMASCMAEHGLGGPVIGVTFDGTGYGTDGAVWGGEFLVGDYVQFRRAAHFRYVGMPGGDQAIREPWRMAVAHLSDSQLSNESLKARVLRSQLQAIERMLERHFRTPPTSSAGRLFDAVAALAGVRDRVSYEGQAAVELESLASCRAPCGVYPFSIARSPGADSAEPLLLIDTRPLIRAVADDANRNVEAALIGRRFHSTLVDIIAAACTQIRDTTGLGTVVLSGGVFLNALLTREASARLRDEGFAVHRHRLVPPNDGGLSLGQLAIAAAVLAAGLPPGGKDRCASESPAR